MQPDELKLLQEETVASLLRLWESDKRENILQAMVLADSLEDPEMFARLAAGLFVDQQGYLEYTYESVFFRMNLRQDVMLWAAKRAGLLHGHKKLCICAKNVSNLSELNGVPLKELVLEGVWAECDVNSMVEYESQRTTLDDLPYLPTLQSLVLDSFRYLHDLSWVAKVPNLRRLTLKDCRQLKDLSALSSLVSLEVL